jgi:hypothetical protein
VVSDESRLPELREALAGSGIAGPGGPAGLVEAAARGADVTLAGDRRLRGLAPTMAAIEQGGIVALANKEALVSAGEVMTAAVARARRDAAAGRFRAQRDLPVPRRQRPGRRAADHADRERRAAARLEPRAAARGDPGAGGRRIRTGRWAPRSASIRRR